MALVRLYLHGTRDRLVAPQCQAEMLLVRPGKTVAVDGPHLLFQREPALTAGILVDFVRGLATEPKL